MGHEITENCADMWPDRRLLELFNIELPIVQAPVAGAMDWELAVAAAEAGALASLPCAMLNPDQVREQMAKIRARTKKPVNLNFFCHTPPVLNNAREARWRERLAPYYRELAIAGPLEQSHRIQFRHVRCRRGDEARRRKFPFRAAGGGAPAAAQGGTLPGDEFGDHRGRGALARSARRRRRDRAGLRGRRPSRQLLGR